MPHTLNYNGLGGGQWVTLGNALMTVIANAPPGPEAAALGGDACDVTAPVKLQVRTRGPQALAHSLM